MSPDPKDDSKAWAPLAQANLAAQSAEQLCLAAMPIVAVSLLQAGPAEVGLLNAAQTLPYLLLALPLGLLADRVPRRRLMGLAEGLRALTLLALALAVWAGTAGLPLLALLGFLGAVGTVGFSVAAPALLPALVPPAQLALANGRIELARSLAFAAGPAAAGALVAWAGAGPAFGVAAALSVLALQRLLLLHEPPRALPPRRQPWHELRQGGGFVRRHRLLRPILVTSIVWNLAWGVLQAAFVPHAMSRLGLSAAGVGLLMGLYGVGMVVGALATPRLLRAMPFGLAVLLGPLVSVVAALCMAASTLWPQPTWAAMSFVLFGAGPIVWTISSTTLRQRLTPTDLLGRVGAIFLTVNAGARPLGSLLGAWAGLQWGAAACLWLSALGFVVQALVISVSPVRPLARLPEPVHEALP